MYLLDTDTVIFNFKGHEAIRKNLLRCSNEPIKLCIITLMELYYGAYKSQKVASNLAKIKMLETSLDILPFGQEPVEIFGMCKAGLEAKGTPLDDFDMALAACALAHNLILVTNNTKHFQRIAGLRITNWTEFPAVIK